MCASHVFTVVRILGYLYNFCFILALLGVASASGYQMVVSVGEAKQIKDMAITSLQVHVLIISAFFNIVIVHVCVDIG